MPSLLRARVQSLVGETMMIVQALRYGGQKKENEVLMASYNMDEFDNIILNERRQSQKALYYMILFM